MKGCGKFKETEKENLSKMYDSKIDGPSIISYHKSSCDKASILIHPLLDEHGPQQNYKK